MFEETTDAGFSMETAGAHIGPYRLLEQIGEGGMGQVWVAEQKSPVIRRVVALHGDPRFTALVSYARERAKLPR